MTFVIPLQASIGRPGISKLKNLIPVYFVIIQIQAVSFRFHFRRPLIFYPMRRLHQAFLCVFSSRHLERHAPEIARTQRTHAFHTCPQIRASFSLEKDTGEGSMRARLAIRQPLNLTVAKGKESIFEKASVTWGLVIFRLIDCDGSDRARGPAGASDDLSESRLLRR